jgi:hypothetical protein
VCLLSHGRLKPIELKKILMDGAAAIAVFTERTVNMTMYAPAWKASVKAKIRSVPDAIRRTAISIVMTTKKKSARSSQNHLMYVIGAVIQVVVLFGNMYTMPTSPSSSLIL